MKEKSKEEKKHAEKKPKASHGDEEEPESFEPREKDPFAGLPKSTFDLDAFKRVYSNEDTLTKAVPYFWEHFDPANYSIWYCEYKYPSELAKIYMSCNLITGNFFLSRKL
ncbi:unnamed protein product [Soboliphyme baturini]|uniref:EF-1-gamma C-terminal domain-containing protein n=1 Tax=Soboliphyme baturini TaxID=241478 RepID=A0A183JBC1_9BILA|nr:unnamed protein product [Soboliphyme baturini]